MGLDFNYSFGQTPLSLEETEGLLIKSITTRSEPDDSRKEYINSIIQADNGNIAPLLRFARKGVLK